MAFLGKIILASLLAFVGHRAFEIWRLLGTDIVVHNHTPGPCRTVPGVEKGSEDIQKLSNGKALITSGMRNYMDIKDNTFSDRTGKIFLFDFNNPNEPIRELQIEGDVDLVNSGPHGISVWEDQHGGVTVFVVVHRLSGESIEKFRFISESNTLRHLQTITSDKYMWKINDVHAVSENSFYFTNYQYTMGILEGLFGLKWGGVVFFDGDDYRIVADNMFGTNGIMSSPDGKFLYVAHAGKAVNVYQKKADFSLKFLRDIPVGTSPDNIDVDQSTGDIWIGCHPIGYKVLHYLQDPTYPAPSQVLRFQMENGKVKRSSEVYVDDGVILKGSTVAVRHQMAMLVGTVHDKLLYCDFKHLD